MKKTTGSQSSVLAAAALVSKPSIAMLPVTKYENKKRQERMARFATTDLSHSKNNKQQQPSQRHLPTCTKTTSDDFVNNTDDNDADPYYDIIGTNMEIEKSYLRLTTYPKCADVRPLSILIKALEHVKRKYHQNDDFDWCNDQLKSIRQDITVQKSYIPPNHTLLLDVYQTHARILLEHGQLSEFNQCLSNVLQIYDIIHDNNNSMKDIRHTIIHSSDAVTDSTTSNSASVVRTTCNDSMMKAEGEFRAYSVLYNVVQSKSTFLDLNIALRRRLQQQQQTFPPQRKEESTAKHSKKSKKRRRSSPSVSTAVGMDSATSRSMNVSNGYSISNGVGVVVGMMKTISVEEQHAWDVVQSIYDGQYTKFFGLYDTAPHMSPYILDFLLHRIRLQAYAMIVTAFRPNITVEYIQQNLHFDTIQETYHFLQQRQAAFVPIESSKTQDVVLIASIPNGHQNRDDENQLLIDCRESQQLLT